MKRAAFLLAMGLALGAVARLLSGSQSPLLTAAEATPEAWPLD